MFKLRYSTAEAWTQTVINNMDGFLPDHAMAEKKASGMAMSLVSHYPDQTELVKVMIDVAIEELAHFRDVIKIMQERNIPQAIDEKDAYINLFRKSFRKGGEEYMMDRLILAAIVEARGAERFGLIHQNLEEGKLKIFYKTITLSEERHQNIFIELAHGYLNKESVNQRLDELLDVEAKIVSELPIRCALH